MEIITEYERIREVVKDLDPEQCGLEFNSLMALCAEAEEVHIAEIIKTAYLFGWKNGYEAARH